MTPLVSVIMPTYNHEKFIAQAIEGVLAQVTQYPYELLIGEDESSDGTREICMEYARQNPTKISVSFGKRADVIQIQGKPTGRANFLRLLQAARGEYLALCEGDDYWTDQFKLQKQVDFLELHQEYSFCFHDCKLIDANGSLIADHFCRPNPTGQFPLEELFKENRIPTCSKVFRAKCVNRHDPVRSLLALDWLMNIQAGITGKIHYSREVWGAYRIHSAGIWQGMQPIEMKQANYLALKSINMHLSYAYQDLIQPSLRKRNIELLWVHVAHRRIPSFLARFFETMRAEIRWLLSRLTFQLSQKMYK